MTITAKNIGRINVWPTYAIARDADTAECKFIGQLTVWQTNEEALANMSHEEEGGGGDLDWVPDNAKIHIDLVGGDPQGRAWVDGTGVVAVDTLLGTDANTESGWSATVYDPDQLGADGYQGSTNGVAFIGELRTAILSGATMVVRQKHATGGIAANPFVAVAADGNAGVFFQLSTEPNEAKAGSYVGDLASIPSIVNAGDASFNVIAFTTTPTRLDYAVNGSSAEAVALTAEDYPVSGESQIVATLVDTSSATEYVQSITLYDPLPSTAGLSELSEVT